jgi:NACalpha-BTF3-like transcription factor
VSILLFYLGVVGGVQWSWGMGTYRSRLWSSRVLLTQLVSSSYSEENLTSADAPHNNTENGSVYCSIEGVCGDENVSMWTDPADSSIQNEDLQQYHQDDDRDNAKKVQDSTVELQKLGWSTEDAVIALQICEGDVTAAAAYLQEQQEKQESMDVAATDIEVQHGWKKAAALYALTQTNGDVDLALVELEKNELSLAEEFENNVLEMVSYESVYFLDCQYPM